MIKQGDRVAPFNHMGLTGTVVSLRREKVKTWMVGGCSADHRFRATVLLDESKEEREFLVSELMRVD
jgi:hypothetical protein